MSENNPNLSQKPSRLDRIKSIARNTGAVAESAAVAITGVAAFEAAVDTGPAYAGTEAATLHETQSPQQFINGYNVKFTDAVHTMHNSPYFKNKSIPAVKNAKFQIICAPSEEYHGLYDCLDVAVNKGEPIPEGATLYLGADSKDFQNIKSWKQGYTLATTAGAGLGKWLALTEDKGPKTIEHSKNFYVSTVGYSTIAPGSNNINYTYDKNRNTVSNAYSDFLKRMKQLIAQK